MISCMKRTLYVRMMFVQVCAFVQFIDLTYFHTEIDNCSFRTLSTDAIATQNNQNVFAIRINQQFHCFLRKTQTIHSFSSVYINRIRTQRCAKKTTVNLSGCVQGNFGIIVYSKCSTVNYKFKYLYNFRTEYIIFTCTMLVSQHFSLSIYHKQNTNLTMNLPILSIFTLP